MPSSFPTVNPQPIRALYTISVIVVFLFVMAFVFLMFYAVIMPVRSTILTTMTQYDVANSTYPNFELADTFMNNLWAFSLVLAVFGLLYWVYIYSQRKGVSAYAYE